MKIPKYIEQINELYDEIKEIKKAECLLDYDTKTEIIEHKIAKIKDLKSFATFVPSIFFGVIA